MSKFFCTTIAFLGLILQISAAENPCDLLANFSLGSDESSFSKTLREDFSMNFDKDCKVYPHGVDVNGHPLLFEHDYEIHVLGLNCLKNERLRLFVSKDPEGADFLVEAHQAKKEKQEDRNIFTIKRPNEEGSKNHLRLYNKITDTYVFSSNEEHHNVLKIAGRGMIGLASVKLGDDFQKAAINVLDLKPEEHPSYYVEAHLSKFSSEPRNNLLIIAEEKHMNSPNVFTNLIQVIDSASAEKGAACFLFVSRETRNNDYMVLCSSVVGGKNFQRIGWHQFIFVPVN